MRRSYHCRARRCQISQVLQPVCQVHASPSYILVIKLCHAKYTRMIIRQKSQLIRARLDRFPAVALLGPRQTGKTTLAGLIAEELLRRLFRHRTIPKRRSRRSHRSPRTGIAPRDGIKTYERTSTPACCNLKSPDCAVRRPLPPNRTSLSGLGNRLHTSGSDF